MKLHKRRCDAVGTHFSKWCAEYIPALIQESLRRCKLSKNGGGLLWIQQKVFDVFGGCQFGLFACRMIKTHTSAGRSTDTSHLSLLFAACGSYHVSIGRCCCSVRTQEWSNAQAAIYLCFAGWLHSPLSIFRPLDLLTPPLLTGCPSR